MSPAQKLGLVRGDGKALAVAYAPEEDLNRLKVGDEARFIPGSLDFPAVTGRVERIDPSPVKALQDGQLSSVHGGDIPARVSGRQIIPEGAVTRVMIRLDRAPPDLELGGNVIIEGERRSILGRLARSVLIVLIREWGT